MRFDTVHPKDIRIMPDRNPRMDWGDIEGLANSILESGLHVPLKVEMDEKQYLLVDGERRLRALRKLVEDGLWDQEITVHVLESDGLSEEGILLSMILSNDGKPFLPLEESVAFSELKKLGMSSQDISKKIGKSISYVNDRLSLLQASDEIKEAVQNQEVPTVLAKDIAKKYKDDPEMQNELLEEAKGNPNSVRSKLYGLRLPKREKEVGALLVGIANNNKYKLSDLASTEIDRNSPTYIAHALDVLATIHNATSEQIAGVLEQEE